MKKRGMVFLILSMVIVLIPIFVFSQAPPPPTDGTTTEVGTTEQDTTTETPELTQEQLGYIDFQTQFESGQTATMGTANPSDVNSFILEKFPNMNPDSLPDNYPAGSSLSPDGTLSVNGNKINLKQFTGSHKVVAGNDGSLTINGKFYSNARITADGNTITAEPIEQYHDEQASLTISGGTRMESSPNRVLVVYAESINILNSDLDKVHYFIYDMGDNFKVDEADDVFINNIHFYNIKNSSFTILENELISAKIQARQNQTYELWNPIENSFNNIDIIAEKDCEFDLKFKQTDSQNRQKFEITIPQCITVELYNNKNKKLIFNSQSEKATLTLTEGIPPAYSIKNGNLTFQSSEYEEILEGVGTAYIDNELGAQELILKPLLVIHPGGRYTYEDKTNKESSFSLFNHGKVDFYLGLNKEGELTYSSYKKEKIKNWGFIDIPGDFKELNGVISYEKYGTVPITENIQETKLLNIYTKNDIKNTAVFNEDNNRINLFLANKDPEEEDIAEVDYGTSTITDNIYRRMLTISQIPKTYFVESYKYESRPEIIFKDRTAITANVIVYNVVNELMLKSSALSDFENMFNSQINSVNQQYRSFHLYLTQEQ